MHCSRKWNIKQTSGNKTSIIDKLLEIRGITSKESKHLFLNPLEITLTHPNAFCEMQKATERIKKAIDEKEKIYIYGDFDADGVTSTSLLLKTLTYLGADVSYYIPNRESENHGLNSKALVPIISKEKAKLIITVDNGISNIEEVKMINSLGRDVIITDHHEAPDTLPDAYAIINPKVMNALDEKLTTSQIESLTSLAGVGVAFKLAQGILEKYDKLSYSYELLPYVTVGTIADLVPLIGENRYFVTKGLELIRNGKHYGIKRLLDIAGVNVENGLTSEQIAFSVAPRINASGRLDTVDAAVKLMTSDNKQEIELAIITLDNYNKIRQELCSTTFAEADEMWQNTGMKDNAIVLFKPDWHIGIVGIVASKFVEKYYKPTFIVTYSEESQQFRCSARGVNELSIYDILSNMSELLDGFGGHKLAGGFSFSEGKATFEQIKKSINQTIDEMLSGTKLTPSLDIDMELTLGDIDTSLIDEISKMEPFGMSNPSPSFVMKDVTIKQKKLMGAKKDHLKLIIDSPNGTLDCVWWSRGDVPLSDGDKMDIAFAPQTNTFNGATSIQLILKDIHSDSIAEEEVSKIKIYDQRKKKNIFTQVNDYIKTSKLGISVFAEDETIIEMLKPYKSISEKIVNRQNAVKNDVLMFFDYPADEDIYKKIKQTVSPAVYHYMYYQIYNTDYSLLFKTFTGMIKYAANNLDGKIELERASARLGITNDAVESMLSLFEECNCIKITDSNEDFYQIQFLNVTEVSKLMQNPRFAEFAEIMNTIKDYKNSFMQKELQN